MREDGAGRVAVDVSVEGVVSVAGSVDALGGCAGIVVDRFAVRPGCREFWDVAQWTEDASARMNGIGGPYVI